MHCCMVLAMELCLEVAAPRPGFHGSAKAAWLVLGPGGQWQLLFALYGPAAEGGPSVSRRGTAEHELEEEQPLQLAHAAG